MTMYRHETFTADYLYGSLVPHSIVRQLPSVCSDSLSLLSRVHNTIVVVFDLLKVIFISWLIVIVDHHHSSGGTSLHVFVVLVARGGRREWLFVTPW